jgi:NAD(P)H-dependent FMN reductase
MTEEDANDPTPDRLRVGVIAGSTRPGRQSVAVAEWVCADDTSGLDLRLVDLAEIDLPLLDEPMPAACGDYQRLPTRTWSKLVQTFDAFVLVTPEYNHSTSAVMKNALDHLYWEWHDKPVAFVGYGLDGGTRAVEHLRAIVAELGMAGVGPQVAINLVADYTDGHLETRPLQLDARVRMLSQLARWAMALRSLRRQTQEAGASNRPVLDDPLFRAGGNAAIETFVTNLQRGLDQADADLYDDPFATDVLWGSPYGATLVGHGPLNAIHRSIMAGASLPGSRYEVIQTMAPADGVLVAQVRRNDLNADPGGGFSEMALYVLVERAGKWWLAAGQNTPIVPQST